jgi:hypothetical protein
MREWRDELRFYAMAEKDDDLDATLSFRVSTKERQRVREMADREDKPESRVARRLFRQALRESDDGGGLAA